MVLMGAVKSVVQEEYEIFTIAVKNFVKKKLQEGLREGSIRNTGTV